MYEVLHIDLETYSDIDITKAGVYKYVDSPNFKILLFAYAFNDEEVKIIDFEANEKLPDEVFNALTDPGITKIAHNANFERNALRSYFNMYMKPEQWFCTMVAALRLGLPGSLAMVGKVLNFKEEKMAEGKALIRFFCCPKKAIKDDNQLTFLTKSDKNLSVHYPEKWSVFKQYCLRDVVVEREIYKKLDKFKTTQKEHQLWYLDQEINDRGVNIDIDLVNAALELDKLNAGKLTKEARILTGLSNPNSPAQLKKWIGDKVGYEITELTKDSILDIYKSTEDEDVKKVLKLRTMLAKTSVKKYDAMKLCSCNDGKARGLTQFYGANRTGRFSGRLIQTQNLPQNHLQDLDEARNLVKDKDIDNIEFLYDSVSDTLSQLIRTALIPSKGCRFIVSDFSAIEARVIAWLAGEEWRLEVFKNNEDIYCASAEKMFKVPVKKHGENGHLRQKGKIAELACGYGGSVGALKAMDKKGDIPEEALKPLIDDWRNANPNITAFWWEVDRAAKKAIKQKTTVTIKSGIKFFYKSGILFIELLSGRCLAYIKPRIDADNRLSYEGLNQTTKKWEIIDTYGPKLVENIVQATARDCLCEGMIRLNEVGYKIVFHVHDEVVIDVPFDFGSLEEVNSILALPIEWANGLLLKAEGYECYYYKKD